jgi:DNA polymerase-3 subunit epsilon
MRPFPGAVIDQEALDVAGVTREQIMAYPSPDDAYKYLHLLLSQYVSKFDKKDKFHLSGYNIMGFDNEFLRAFWKRYDKYFGSFFWSDCIDVMSEASSFLRKMRPAIENFKLKTIAKVMKINIDESKLHDAVYDVELTMEIYDRINKVRKQIK